MTGNTAYRGAALAALLSASAHGFSGVSRLPSPATHSAATTPSAPSPIGAASARRTFLPPPRLVATTTSLGSAVFEEKEESVVEEDDLDSKMIEAAFERRRWEAPTPYEDMTVGIMKETYPGENRVSIAPESAALLTKAGFNVVVESGG